MKATIKSIKSVESLNIVEFNFYSNHTLTMMSLELSCDITIGTKIELAIKPTNIIISKDFNTIISCDNKLKATIIEIDNGELLSSVKLAVEDEVLESIITYSSSKVMGLEVGDSVMVLIQASDLSISEVL